LRFDMQGVHWFYNGVELMFHGLRGPRSATSRWSRRSKRTGRVADT
jgi:hypothetical protein